MGSKDPDLPKIGPGDAQPVVVVADLSPSLGAIPFEPRATIGLLIQGAAPTPRFFQLLSVGQATVVDSVTLTVSTTPPAAMTWALSRIPVLPTGASVAQVIAPVQLGGATANAEGLEGPGSLILPLPNFQISTTAADPRVTLTPLNWFIPTSFRLTIQPTGPGSGQGYNLEMNWRELEQPVGSA